MLDVKRAAAALGVVLAPLGASAAEAKRWTVRQRWVEAHQTFLASDALQGRGSATRDEAIAAAYVAAQFRGYGLATAPGLASYLQTATIVRFKAGGGTLTVAGKALAGATVLAAMPDGARGKLAVFAGTDPATLPTADVVVATASTVSAQALSRAAQTKHVKLLIVAESQATRDRFKAIGSAPSIAGQLDGLPPPPRVALVTLPAGAVAVLAKQVEAEVTLALSDLKRETATTTNAIGYLPGTDPAGGVLLLSAHLDHLGMRADGTVMYGANDDASGTTAVLELAHALSAGKRLRRGILFVAYGAEEIGGYGSRWFATHPPVPLARIVANVEFEMIGAHDPKFTGGALMMTGYERSDLGAMLKRHGAKLMTDPYPTQHFFERSDNYQLALEGVVAHTVSGWAVTPTYHQPTDTIAAIDYPFMTRAIQSLVAPMRWLANGRFVPKWAAGGRPVG